MGRARGLERIGSVLGGVLALVAVGCAGDASGSAAGTFTPATSGTLVVATNLPAPGFWEGPDDAPTGGFEHGLALALMEQFDLDELRVVDVPFEALVAGDLGGADLALAQITPTAARDDVLDFSTAYLDAHPAVLVRRGTEVDDLAAARELRWAVQTGTTQVALATERIRPDVLVELADIQSVVDAVASGDVDAALLDLPVALVEERLTDGALEVVAQFATDDVIAVAVRAGDPNLEALDSAVRALLNDGTIDDLTDEWLGQDALEGAVDIPVIRTQPVG